MSIVKGKNLTKDNLRRQGVVIPDWCSLCKSDGVSIDHLFIHCWVVRELWNFLWNLLG